MKKHVFVFLLLTVGVFENESIYLLAQPQKSFKQTGKASFEAQNTDEGIEYKTIVTTYKVIQAFDSKEYKPYLATFTTETIKNLTHEGQKRKIEVAITPIFQLGVVKSKIVQECDELELFHNYYQTLKYGCCDISPEYKLFDYNNNLMIEGTEYIYKGIINNGIVNDFYFAYKTTNDTLSLGSFNFWFGKDKQYQVVLKCKRMSVRDGIEKLCPILYPKISIPKMKKDTIENTKEYYFHSMNHCKSTDDINFTVNLQFDCDENIPSITIPIQHGKPFGKDSKLQTIEVKYLYQD